MKRTLLVAACFLVSAISFAQEKPAEKPRKPSVPLKLQVVYARPVNPAPHGMLRNLLSSIAKSISVRLLGNGSPSFRASATKTPQPTP